MHRGITGHYHVTRSGDEPVRAFVPHPLPPQPGLDLSGERQRGLERATVALGRLDSMSALIPDPQRFLYAYVRREAVLSSQIEGAQSSLSDLMLFELNSAAPVADVVEVSNYIAALEHGMARLRAGFPLSGRLVRELHARLLAPGRGGGKEPGEFRRSQNWIGGARPGVAHFVPPPAAAVGDAMSALERFLHAETPACSTLVTAALAHAQFETIHPFLDGNGRVGRLLIPLLLHQAGLLRQPLLFLSLYFKQHRDEYYRRLDAVRTEGDWEAWIEFFLAGVENAAGGAVSIAARLDSHYRDDRARLQALPRAPGSLFAVLDALRLRPLQNLRQLAATTALSRPTAASALRTLAGLGIVHELTGYRRNRVFAYTRALAILSEGTEPLPN